MTIFVIILFAFSLLAVLVVLGIGLATMARGGEISLKYGNKLMQWRIVMQACAILFFIIVLFALKN